MDSSFDRQSSDKTTVEWITPPEIMTDLGHFDVDPCASRFQKKLYATTNYFVEDNGLIQTWTGKVWCNPPYVTKDATAFLKKMSEHNNGMVLIFARPDTKMWHNYIFPKATAIFFIKGRIAFHKFGDSSCTEPAGAPSCLIAYGKECADILEQTKLEGYFVRLKSI